jgi:CheY-like chemotaxis protein
MIVDRNTASANHLAGELRAKQWDVYEASSSAHALAVLRFSYPTLILLDLAAVPLEGIVLAQQLKEDPDTSDIALVGMMSFSGEDAQRLAGDLGFEGYFRKPLDAMSVIALFPQLHGVAA